MNEELCYENYKRVEEILGRYDSKLGELFHRMARPMLEELCHGRERQKSGLLPTIGRDLADIDLLEADGINMIPSDTKTGCHESCIVYVDGEWRNRKANSFLSRSKVLLTYWLECFNVNKRTLVLTSSWDEQSFSRNCRVDYDNYANNHHAVAVVLMTSTGPSIQYLGK